MIAHNPKSLCREAELYYYDFLCNESRGFIPEPIANHVEQCQHCREQINQLETVLSQADSLESEQGRVSSAVTTMLKLHFAYIGKPVTCNIVKPFLPTLLDQALGIHIPTPIVTHVCDCQQCSEDLDIVRCLNLSRKQLCRLSQLFAEKSAGSDISSCTEAQNAIPSVVPMVFSETDLEVLKHLCTCPICRKLVYKERQKLCDGLPEYTSSSEFPCESVSTSDFFDYVVPYGIDPANDQYAKFRESLTSHLRTCPTCLAKMQRLHDTVYYIIERAESEVVTIYHIEESAKAKATSESDDIYAGFPIRVDVKQREEEVKAEQLVPAIDFAATLKQKVSVKKLKPLFKTAVAAAAVILIAAILFQSIPARAVTLERIYEAIEKVKNVHIASFVPGRTKPTQERWVSRTANTYMLKTEKESVLWDITKGVRKSKQLNAAITETVPLTTVLVADAETKITGSLGLMPFYDISDVPQDAEWSHVADNSLQDITKGTEVYDLTWIERKHIGFVVYRKWRVFANAETNLPQRIEWYEKSATDSEYTLSPVMTVEYLSDGEIQEVIKEASF
jgi:hypothetical protein